MLTYSTVVQVQLVTEPEPGNSGLPALKKPLSASSAALPVDKPEPVNFGVPILQKPLSSSSAVLPAQPEVKVYTHRSLQHANAR